MPDGAVEPEPRAPPSLELVGWDISEDGQMPIRAYVRRGRRAKLSLHQVSFADRGAGWQAKLWTKDEPHGRSEFAAETVDVDADAFRRKVYGLLCYETDEEWCWSASNGGGASFSTTHQSPLCQPIQAARTPRHRPRAVLYDDLEDCSRRRCAAVREVAGR